MNRQLEETYERILAAHIVRERMRQDEEGRNYKAKSKLSGTALDNKRRRYQRYYAKHRLEILAKQRERYIEQKKLKLL